MSSVNINAYLHVRKANNPVYHPNGERLTFLTDYTGLPQVWELNRGEGWPSQISYTDERIMFVQYITGTTKRIVGMDEGVNERQQLFLLEDDGEMIPLTDSPDHIHHYGGSSPDGKFIAWASNRREHAFFDLYIQNLDTLEFQRVFSGNGNFKVLKWHPSGRQLLIEKTNASLDNDLGLLDLETGEGHWFTLHDGEALFQSPQFSGDGRILYVLTNKDHEYLSLAAIDVQTNSWTWLDEKGWDLEGLTMSPDKTKLAYTVNEGGKSKGVILDIDRHSFQLWETPPGTISDLTFSPDGAKLAYVFNGATHPADIWELAIASNRSERITYVSQSPAVEKELVEPELIHFTSFDGLEVPAFYYKPKNVSHGEKFPVVVFVHGGPESQIRSVYNPFLQYFLNRGYAVCTPNVRGSTGYGKTYTHLDDVRKRMDSVKDLTALVDWLTTEGDAAPDKIAIMGRSYGGFMVLAAITHYPKLWSAAIDIVGISSFRTFLENTSSWRRKLRESEYGSIEEDGDFFDEIDPLHRTDQITCPVMVLHGANDPRVPIEETEQIVDDLKGRNHPVTYIRFEDEGHFFVKLKNNITAYTGVADFLDNYIGK
ncbi:dipeptidyl aminopeptidase/acylaminoacyl peptidase [Evansella vedderi]|uniref:Dipeptidyl aminopeptidase/acylaminoacyl peptidase n=1 Tax=Evansella vedderi TaxID=38282 RepID=A0ABU0A1H4_9BACI|nr:S9 family peptidase [Evansella vedderi]MDQ0256857.1 dipeptidyl aminopeptidase/acylaminoacyl peptidase [Evansella vedderi]